MNDNVIIHSASNKYIDRKWKNGKWQYTYEDDVIDNNRAQHAVEKASKAAGSSARSMNTGRNGIVRDDLDEDKTGVAEGNEYLNNNTGRYNDVRSYNDFLNKRDYSNANVRRASQAAGSSERQIESSPRNYVASKNKQGTYSEMVDAKSGNTGNKLKTVANNLSGRPSVKRSDKLLETNELGKVQLLNRRDTVSTSRYNEAYRNKVKSRGDDYDPYTDTSVYLGWTGNNKVARATANREAAKEKKANPVKYTVKSTVKSVSKTAQKGANWIKSLFGK